MKRSALLVALATILIGICAACRMGSYSTARPSVEVPVESVTPSRTGTGSDVKVGICDSRTKLVDLLGADFTGMEIKDIRWESYDYGESIIYVFLRGFDDAFHSNQSHEFSEILFGEIPTEHCAAILGKEGIEVGSIRAYGLSYKDNDNGGKATGIEMQWFLLDDAQDGRSNIVLFAWIPCKVALDVDKIISE